MDLNLINENTKVPLMMFHGSSDPTVPYGTAAHHYCKTNATGWLMFFGSYSIYNKLLDLNESTTLITYCGGGHKYAGAHFSQDQQPVLDFMNDVLAGEKNQIHIIYSKDQGDERSAVYEFCN